MSTILRLAVFDVDGTLIDSQHNIVAAMTLAWQMHGLGEPRPEAVRRIIGLSLVEACARLLPEPDEALALAVAHSYKDAFVTLRGHPDHSEPLFPGAVEALVRLEEDGWLLGIATGKSKRGLDAMLDRHGLHGRFLTMQTADDNPSKPHPAMMMRALGETGVDAAAAVMIGDTAYDMLMARQAGAHALGVAWGNHPPEELEAAGAEAVANDYEGLPALLDGLVGGRACA